MLSFVSFVFFYIIEFQIFSVYCIQLALHIHCMYLSHLFLPTTVYTNSLSRCRVNSADSAVDKVKWAVEGKQRAPLKVHNIGSEWAVCAQELPH